MAELNSIIPSISYKDHDSTGDSSAHICPRGGCFKLEVHDWLKDLPAAGTQTDLAEIRFKSTRKGFYKNVNNLKLAAGDIVAVEASPGHDIGIITLTGPLVLEQIKKYHPKNHTEEYKKIYRKANESDIIKWREAISREKELLVRTREIIEQLGLQMKLGDVEFQGDKTKAIFYYIADERVDFRELIKIMAEQFKIRIEMRQIGARQEAGRIGGVGPCGREICCTTWLTGFVSVSTGAARYQDLSMNPQKLAGQCSKLKCCLNYEVQHYYDLIKKFPDTSKPIETLDGLAFHKKTDILKRTMWYSFDKNSMANMIPLSVDQVTELYRMNSEGKKPATLKPDQKPVREVVLDYQNSAGKESVTRFDKQKKRRRKK